MNANRKTPVFGHSTQAKTMEIKMVQKAVIYCRVSTSDQSCERQEQDLLRFAERAGYEVIGVYKETGSGAKLDRAERNKILKLAQARKIDAVLITELSRWGRSTTDLLDTLGNLNSWGVSLVAQSGMTFDISTPHGKMLATFLAGISEFERGLIRERVKSGLAAAKARGQKLGRQFGQNPSDKYKTKVLKHIADGRSYRWIAHEMQISKTTVMAIAKRYRAKSTDKKAA